MMTKLLAQSLLRVVQSPEDKEAFNASKILCDFVRESGIGIVRSSQILFPTAQKERIRAWLRADNIDPSASLEAWDGIARSAALNLGPDEKWAQSPVRANRIAFKTLHGKALFIDGRPTFLPRRANLEWLVDDAACSLNHDSVIVVENWETFDRVDDLQVDFTRAGPNPLVVWRGGGLRSSTGAAMSFLEMFKRPVWSAPDYDPEGLAIASRLPYLAGILYPSLELLRALLQDSKLSDRYRQQLPGAIPTLEAAAHPDIVVLWALVRQSGKALPQERLCSSPAIPLHTTQHTC